MPSTPKQLHNIGMVDLNNETTWKVQVVDKEGNPLALLDNEQAFNNFKDTPLEKQLPTESVNEIKRVDASQISWDIKPKEPLTRSEILYLTKNYLGIN